MFDNALLQSVSAFGLICAFGNMDFKDQKKLKQPSGICGYLWMRILNDSSSSGFLKKQQVKWF